MRNSLLIFVVVFFCSASRCFAAGLTIEEAIGVAFKNNKDIRIAEQEVRAARATIEGARSEFLPKLNASAGYTRTGSVMSLSSAQSTKKDPGIFTGYRSDNKLGLELDQNIFSGGANTANLRQKQLSARIQIESLRARKLDTEFEVKRLYYGLLLAHETERIAQNLLDQAQSHYDDVKKKYGQGTTSRFDTLQSSVQVSKLKPELIKAKNAADLIDAELKKLLGLNMHDSISLADSFMYSPFEIAEREFLQAAYLEKPEMILMSLGVDVNRWSIETAKAGHMPQVNAQAGTSYRSNDAADMVNKRHNNWDAGISVSIPIFDGFSTKAKVDEAKARYAQAKLQKENLAEQIAVDIRNVCLDLQKAQSVISSQKDSIDEAKEALKIAAVRYDNGEGTNLDVMDAQVSLSQVEKNMSEGIYDYILAKAYLDRTIGQSSLKENSDEKTD